MAWTQLSLSPNKALSINAPIILQLVSPWRQGEGPKSGGAGKEIT